jgi:AraC-like DNA-binding protein
LFEHNKKSFILFDRLFNSLLFEEHSIEAETLLSEFIEYSFSVQYSLNPDVMAPEKNRVSKIKQMILDQLDINLSLDEFESESGLSRFHLIRSFKKIYGQSPHAFQIDQRIKQSKVLLKQGRGIAEIAAILGFSDQSHFQRNFKKRLAITPKYYQSFFNT